MESSERKNYIEIKYKIKLGKKKRCDKEWKYGMKREKGRCDENKTMESREKGKKKQ